jgi:hypothetical protein
MSALPPKADIAKRRWDVRFVPKADYSPLTALQIALVIEPPTRVLVLRGGSRTMLQLYGNTRSRAMRCLWMLEEIKADSQTI